MTMTKLLKRPGPIGWIVGATLGWAFGLMGVVAITQGARAQSEPAPGAGSVGVVASVLGEVEAKRGIYIRKLAAKDEIFQNERIETGAGAAAEIVLRDNAQIALGPKSSVVFDKVVFDANPLRRKIAITATGGTVKFISGNSPSSVYEFKTPAGTIGLKGTEFVVVVAYNGATSVAVTRGTVLFSNNFGESVVVNKGQASTILPPEAGGRPRAPSAAANTSDAVATAMQQLETMVGDAKAANFGAGPSASRAAADGSSGSRGGGLDDKSAAGTVESVPAKALLGALNGSDDGVKALNEYLRGSGGKPDDIARRAISVLRELKNQKLVKDYDVLVAAADRVQESASNIFNTGAIMKLTIDAGYKVSDRAIALDLEPPDAPTAPGWQSVVPRDARLAGQQMRGIAHPGGDPITSDGILGVDGVNIQVRNDLWRVIVMTEDLGTPQVGGDLLSYFGEELRINENSMSFRKLDPASWSEVAYLTNQKLDVGTFASAGAATSAAAGGDLISNISNKNAGVVVSETAVTANAVDILFSQPSAGGARKPKTYIVGILLEPIEQPSSVKGFPDLTRFLELERQITQKVAELLADADPKAGKLDGDTFENDSKNPSPS